MENMSFGISFLLTLLLAQSLLKYVFLNFVNKLQMQLITFQELFCLDFSDALA